MTVVHILNYSIPIAMMLVIGFTVDKMCQPDAQEQETEQLVNFHLINKVFFVNFVALALN